MVSAQLSYSEISERDHVREGQVSLLSIKSIVWLRILSVSSEHPDTSLPAERCDALGGTIDRTPTTLSNNSRPSLGAAVGSAPSSAPAAWNPHSPESWVARGVTHESIRRRPESIRQHHVSDGVICWTEVGGANHPKHSRRRCGVSQPFGPESIATYPHRLHIPLCGGTGYQSIRNSYSGHYQRWLFCWDAPWWAVCHEVPCTMWNERCQESKRNADSAIFAASRNWGTLSRSVVVAPKTRRQPWCATPSICVYARVWVCHPIWAVVYMAYQVRRPARAPFRWRLVDWEDFHSDPSYWTSELNCHVTSLTQTRNIY